MIDEFRVSHGDAYTCLDVYKTRSTDNIVSVFRHILLCDPECLATAL
jgi:hypothetical protein